MPYFLGIICFIALARLPIFHSFNIDKFQGGIYCKGKYMFLGAHFVYHEDNNKL